MRVTNLRVWPKAAMGLSTERIKQWRAMKARFDLMQVLVGDDSIVVMPYTVLITMQVKAIRLRKAMKAVKRRWMRRATEVRTRISLKVSKIFHLIVIKASATKICLGTRKMTSKRMNPTKIAMAAHLTTTTKTALPL